LVYNLLYGPDGPPPPLHPVPEDRVRAADLDAFPQVPDDDLYDFKHTNACGRLTLSTYLVDWLEGTPKEELVWLGE